MINSILTGIFAGFTVLAGLLLVSFLVFRAVKRKITQAITLFVTPAGENLPSPYAVTVSNLAAVIGSQVAASIKTTFMGVQSVENKNEKRLEVELMAGQNPVLAALMTSFPAVGKRMMKNPELAGLALQVAGKVLGNKIPGNHSSPGEPMQYKFG